MQHKNIYQIAQPIAPLGNRIGLGQSRSHFTPGNNQPE